MSCSIVISRYRLHSLIETHADHDEHEYNTVAYSIRSDSKITAVCAQLLVDEQGHKACRRIHEERSRSDGKGFFCNLEVQSQYAFLEMDSSVVIAEMQHDDDQGYSLRQHGCPCGTCDSHIQGKDEYRVKDCVQDDGEDCEPHSLLRVACRAHCCIQTEVEMSDDVSVEDYLHVLLGVRKCVFTGSEEI